MPTTTTKATPIPDLSTLMRVRDAAMLVHMNPETIRARIRRGEIPAYGRPYRVALPDLLPLYVPGAPSKTDEK